MIIDGREIAPYMPPYVIAEISCNHNGSFENAMKLVRAAKDAGADAVKFQAYTPDTITIHHDSPDFIIKDGPWKGRNLYELYAKAYTPFEWFPALFMAARDMDITPFASVFDKSSVDMLEKLHCPAYKIASMEITDTPLIKYAADTDKPVIVSMGMASSEERGAAAECTKPGKRAFLVCTSGYPTNVEDSNLFALRVLAGVGHSPNQEFGVSDHSKGWSVPVAATAMGATIIEKHLMLGDRETEDFEFSMSPIDFGIMVKQVRNIWNAMQPPMKDAESASRQLRRSLYVVKDIEAGESFTEENIRSIRPAYGMAPGELPWVLTKCAARSLKRGTALRKEHIF